MTNFEYMKELVIKTVSVLDEVELRQLISDTCMDESGTEGIFSCGLCEEIYGDCDVIPGGNGCREKYLDWCNREYKPKVNREVLIKAIERYGIPNKAEALPQEGEEMNELGARIRKLRKAYHLKQSDFGEMLGVNRSYISRLESGKEIPSKTLKMLICEKMDTNMEWLENGNGDMLTNFLRLEQVTKNGVTIKRRGCYERMIFLISMAVKQFAEEMTQGLAEEIAKEMPGERPLTYHEVEGELIDLLIQTIEEIN